MRSNKTLQKPEHRDRQTRGRAIVTDIQVILGRTKRDVDIVRLERSSKHGQTIGDQGLRARPVHSVLGMHARTQQPNREYAGHQVEVNRGKTRI